VSPRGPWVGPSPRLRQFSNGIRSWAWARVRLFLSLTRRHHGHHFVPVITIRTYVHALHYLPHLAHLLLHCLLDLLELLEFGSPRSLPVTNNVVKGIVTVALIGHYQDKACSEKRLRFLPQR
jgi:hypothetical protein